LVRYGVRISWLTITILFVWQLYLISRYSVDVPKLDEWITYFQSDGLVKGLTLQWLFSFHNEHLIVFTKLLAWLNLKFFGLNFVIQNIVNYFIFGGLLASMALYKNRLLGEEKFALFPFFLIFMLSPINYENHLWAFQSQFHLPLLFSVLMLCHAYRSDLSTGSAAAFSVYGLLASYAFSAGVIFVAVYLLCTTVYVVAVMAGERVDRACGMRYLLTTCGLCGMSLCLWFFCYELAGDPHPKVFPYELKFWSFYLSVISFGFGFESEQIVLGIVCLVLAALPPLLLLVRKETRWQATSWHVLTAVLGILAVLAAISVGRAWIYPAKTSRYAEIGFLLIPYTALGWWLVMKEGFRRTAMLSFLWLFCFVAYLDDWSTKGHALFKQISLYNLRYIGAYYAGGSDIHPESATAEDMDRARSLGVRFTRQFTARKAGGE
jgi:hypothetical protein